jgi:hypothetical protein
MPGLTSTVWPHALASEYFFGISHCSLGPPGTGGPESPSLSAWYPLMMTFLTETRCLPGRAPSPSGWVFSVNLPSLSVVPIAGWPWNCGSSVTVAPSTALPSRVTVPVTGIGFGPPDPQPAEASNKPRETLPSKDPRARPTRDVTMLIPRLRLSCVESGLMPPAKAGPISGL